MAYTTLRTESNDHYFRAGFITSKRVASAGGDEGPEEEYMQQVNGRSLISFPAAHVFEFRSPRLGTITKIEFYAPDELEYDCKFDVNTGTRRDNLTTIYTDQSQRPVIAAGQYKVESVVAANVSTGDLISIDIDEANETLKLLTVNVTIE